MSLNPNQKSALEVRMRCLERTLLQIRQSLRHPPEDGVLVFYRPMTKAARAHVEVEIERMLREVAVVAQEFDLHASVEDVGSYVVAQMATAWSALLDTLSLKLKRYGPVDPSLSQTLDPHIQVLIELAQEMGRAANAEPPEFTATQPRWELPDGDATEEKL